MSRRVLLDASFWISLRDEEELGFRQARELADRLFRERVQLLVTPLIFAETHAYFCKTPYLARQILDDFENNPVIHCEALLASDQQEAVRLLRQHRDKSYSFCDAVSFVLMRRLDIRQAASFDDHFRQFGEFEIIP